GGIANNIPGIPVITGTVFETDVDNPAVNKFIAVPSNTLSEHGYGTYQMTANGNWTYTLNNANAAVQALNVNQILTDSFTVRTTDGISKVITITINGTNDNAIILGTTLGSVTENSQV